MASNLECPHGLAYCFVQLQWTVPQPVFGLTALILNNTIDQNNGFWREKRKLQYYYYYYYYHHHYYYQHYHYYYYYHYYNNRHLNIIIIISLRHFKIKSSMFCQVLDFCPSRPTCFILLYYILVLFCFFSVLSCVLVFVLFCILFVLLCWICNWHLCC